MPAINTALLWYLPKCVILNINNLHSASKPDLGAEILKNKVINMQYDVIDLHTHIWPEKLATRAVDHVGDYYSYDMLLYHLYLSYYDPFLFVEQ